MMFAHPCSLQPDGIDKNACFKAVVAEIKNTGHDRFKTPQELFHVFFKALHLDVLIGQKHNYFAGNIVSDLKMTIEYANNNRLKEPALILGPILTNNRIATKNEFESLAEQISTALEQILEQLT